MGTSTTNQAPGLRERKKARTRTAIQQQALRLFREQGYQATTMEQIAVAAEVAPSTVFRYFPTKEDLTVLEDYYSLADAIAQALAAQPPELNPVGAIRAAIRAVFADLSDEERAARYERDLLMVRIPELWAANLGLIVKGRRLLQEAIAQRVGRDEREPQVRVLVDAVVGVGLGVLIDWADDPEGDPAAAMDAAFGLLEEQLCHGKQPGQDENRRRARRQPVDVGGEVPAAQAPPVDRGADNHAGEPGQHHRDSHGVQCGP